MTPAPGDAGLPAGLDRLDPAQVGGIGDMSARQFRAAAHATVDLLADYLEGVEDFAILPPIEPGALRDRLPPDPPEGPEPIGAILADVPSLVEPNATHWQHPGFLAYFATTASGPGILGEFVTAVLGQNPMLWRTSPVGTELEEVVVGWLRRALGLPDLFDGLLTDTASTSSLIAIAAAREAAGLDVAALGLAGRPELGAPLVYTSEEAHSSIEKACMTPEPRLRAARRREAVRAASSHPPFDPRAGSLDDPAGGRRRDHGRDAIGLCPSRRGGVRVGRLLLLAGLIYGLLLLGLATLSGGLLALALPVIVYLAAALIYAPDLPRLQVVREISTDRVQPGATTDITLTIHNERARLEEVLVEDFVPWPLKLTDGQTSKVVLLPSGSSVEIAYTLTGPRGRYQFQNVRVTAADHLGLFRRQALLSAPGSFLVLPEVRPMRQVSIRPLRTRASAGLIPARVGGPGVDFFGVREYQSGDSLRWVNWRATARHTRHIFTNEFEQERIADVGLVLDARARHDLRTGEDSLFEHTVRAVASLADAFLRDGNRVTLLSYGAGLSWVFPGYGRLQRERILQALARAQTGESDIFETLDYLPTPLPISLADRSSQPAGQRRPADPHPAAGTRVRAAHRQP